MTDISDEALAAAAKEGDAPAFESLVHRFERRVHGLCRIFLPDEHDAADATQETFLRAYRGLGRYDPGRRFASWLLTIAANVARDMGEKKRPQPLEEATLDRVSATDDPAMILTGKEDLGRVRAAIERLPARQRMAIALSVEHDLRAPEVAEALGVSVSNVGVLLFRAKARIRSMVR